MVLVWFIERKYINQTERVVINYLDIEGLRSAVGKYVLITNACEGDSIITSKDNSSEKDIIPLFACDTISNGQSHLFSIVENKMYLNMFSMYKPFENCSVDFYEGELASSIYLDYKEKDLITEIGVTVAEGDSFRLYSGKTPQRVKFATLAQLVLISIITIGVCIMLFQIIK